MGIGVRVGVEVGVRVRVGFRVRANRRRVRASRRSPPAPPKPFSLAAAGAPPAEAAGPFAEVAKAALATGSGGA